MYYLDFNKLSRCDRQISTYLTISDISLLGTIKKRTMCLRFYKMEVRAQLFLTSEFIVL